MNKAILIEVKISELQAHPALGDSGLEPNLVKREAQLAARGGKDRVRHLANVEHIGEGWKAFVADVKAHGITRPIFISEIPKQGAKGEKTQYVIDGRHRLLAAQEAGLEQIMCEVVPESQVRERIKAELLRQNYSKGAIAYRAVTLFPDFAKSGHGGDRKASSTLELDRQSYDDLAREFGVSVGTIASAIKLYRIFNNTGIKNPGGKQFFIKGAKAHCEEAVFVPGNGLGGVISAAIEFGQRKFEVDTEEPETPKTAALRIRQRRLKEAETRTSRFVFSARNQFTLTHEEDRPKVVGIMASQLRELPEEMLTGLIEELQQKDSHE